MTIAAATVVRVTTSEMVSAPNDGSVTTAREVVERAAERQEGRGGRLEPTLGRKAELTIQ